MATKNNKTTLFNKGVQLKVHGGDNRHEELPHVFWKLFLALATGSGEAPPYDKTDAAKAVDGDLDYATDIRMLQKWNILMNNWLNNPKNVLDTNRKDRSSARGNLIKELNRTRWSWNVFKKSLGFLDARKFGLSLTITTGDGKEYTTSTDVVLDPESTPEAEEIMAKHQPIITPDEDIPQPP